MCIKDYETEIGGQGPVMAVEGITISEKNKILRILITQFILL
jgi:hypothetical protein